MKLLKKNDTRVIKGAAVILMLMHHMWAFQERIADGGLKGLIPLGNTYLFVFLGHFGKVCVPLFFFLGGYGLAKRYEGESSTHWADSKNCIFLIGKFSSFSSRSPSCFSETRVCTRRMPRSAGAITYFQSGSWYSTFWLFSIPTIMSGGSCAAIC